ncbi:MAG: 30S ribosomal protein S5 [Planctomycetes bacterium]|jgi:small subunit ribosomal protein S5|nr:30S ribosomal protein S5 [Planctomycetota bacterium]
MVKRKFPVLPLQEAAEFQLEDEVVAINRSAAVVKGGRRFSFSCLCVVGNREGVVGIGYGKAKQVQSAVEKSVKDGRKNLVRIKLDEGTIPHEIEGRYCASIVRLVPASAGTGIIAGGSVRKVLELAGVKDILSKSFGSNNPINLVKATMDGLIRLRHKAVVAELRGVEI